MGGGHPLGLGFYRENESFDHRHDKIPLTLWHHLFCSFLGFALGVTVEDESWKKKKKEKKKFRAKDCACALETEAF
jgi:hypothetical protein